MRGIGNTAGRKAIFISGGGSGIGRAIAHHFAGREWCVGVGDINTAGMTETAALLPQHPIFATQLDVRSRSSWDEALREFAQFAGGQINVLVNNAGIGFGGNLADITEHEVDQMIEVNFRGMINGARAAYPYLVAARPDRCLLNIASASALYGTAGLTLYSATKFAVRGMTEALELEWECDGIRCCSIMPSFVDTPLLAGPADPTSNQSKRDRVLASGLEFTPVEVVAEAAWTAIHGRRTHTLVGQTARQLYLAARWSPSYLRWTMRRLLKAREGGRQV
jgi:NAD(P)-dependent dehydrogenase (short-subunit alcohol dehydrogenase family)